MSSAAMAAAWLGPRSARSRLKTSTHWLRASSTVLGDEVGDVAVAAAGHADVGRGGAGGLAESEVCGVDGLALGSVGGGGVGELDVLADVVGGQRALAGAAGDVQAAVGADAGHGPGVAVGDAEVAVVASGGDPVAEADPLTTTRDGLTSTLTRWLTRSLTGARSPAAWRWSRMAALRARDLVAGVGDDQLLTAVARRRVMRRCARAAVRSTSLAWTTIWPRSSSASKTSPDSLTSAHEQAEVGVRGVGEPVDGLELEVRFGWHPAGGEVEDAAAADGRQLVAVAEERDGAWARSAMASSARAVSWSSMPASSTSRTSPGSSRARASGAASVWDQWPSSSHR